jgi:hypothetical protein
MRQGITFTENGGCAVREYKGKSKTLSGLGIAIAALTIIILAILLTVGFSGLPAVFVALIALVISFLYKGMIIKITLDNDKVTVYRPLGRKSIRFSDIAFCMVHGIDETDSIIYAFIKKRTGGTNRVRGVKQNLSFEEVIKAVNKSEGNIDFDINFNMAEKIPVSFVENAEDLKKGILETLGGHQKRILKDM